MISHLKYIYTIQAPWMHWCADKVQRSYYLIFSQKLIGCWSQTEGLWLLRIVIPLSEYISSHALPSLSRSLSLSRCVCVCIYVCVWGSLGLFKPNGRVARLFWLWHTAIPLREYIYELVLSSLSRSLSLSLSHKVAYSIDSLIPNNPNSHNSPNNLNNPDNPLYVCI